MFTILLATIAACVSANNAVQLGNTLERRIPLSQGGWALSATSCPVGSSLITYQSFQGCCPTTYQNQEFACCPANSNCLSALQATPYCANTDWVLWNSTTQPAGQGFFCCLADEKGTDDMTCTSNATEIAAASQAARLGRPEPSGVTLTGTSRPTATTSMSTTTSSTTTSSTSSTATHASSAMGLHPPTFGISSFVGFCTSCGLAMLGAILFNLNM